MSELETAFDMFFDLTFQGFRFFWAVWLLGASVGVCYGLLLKSKG